MQRIDVWRTIGSAYALVLGHPWRVLCLGGLWLVFVALAELGLSLPYGVLRSWVPAAALFAAPLVFWAFFGIGLVSFCVALSRVALFGETRPWFAALRFRRRELRWCGSSMAIAALVVAPIFLAMTVLFRLVLAGQRGDAADALVFLIEWSPLLFLALLLLAWAYGSRLTLALPAIAADERGNMFRRAWLHARGNWVRIYVGSIFCTLPFEASNWLIDALFAHRSVFSLHYRLASHFTLKVKLFDGLHDLATLANLVLTLAVLAVFYAYCHQRLVPPPPSLVPNVFA